MGDLFEYLAIVSLDEKVFERTSELLKGTMFLRLMFLKDVQARLSLIDLSGKARFEASCGRSLAIQIPERLWSFIYPEGIAFLDWKGKALTLLALSRRQRVLEAPETKDAHTSVYNRIRTEIDA